MWSSGKKSCAVSSLVFFLGGATACFWRRTLRGDRRNQRQLRLSCG